MYYKKLMLMNVKKANYLVEKKKLHITIYIARFKVIQ